MKTPLLFTFVAVAALSFSSCRSSKTITDAYTVVDPASVIKEVPAATAAGTGYYTPVSASVSNTNTQTVVSQPIVSTTPAVTTTTTTVAPVLQPGDRTEVVNVVNGADAAMLKNYNVVVGSFGNPTNAQNYLNTMKGRGYASFLVQNASGLYRVVAASFDTREAAIATRDEIRSRYTTDDNGLCPSAWLLVPTR